MVFLHWAAEPGTVAHLLPKGTRPDVWEGRTYVGLVAFRVAAPRAFGIVPTGSFNEVNVRLYSLDRDGRRGVVFVTMDADALPSVLAARVLTGVPYIWSDVSLRRGPAGAAGAVRRRLPRGPATGRWSVRPGAAIAEPSGLELFLTARWGLHTTHLGATHWLPVAHPPWPLFRADLLHYEGDLLPAAGLPPADRPPVSTLWSPGTTAALYPPQPV
ncbi:DUF2071 domain-containing protein [Streptomonospora sp. PA3]|nr:DUF2071 domain-containing protein [Streptomonospora sp. PA3]